jgi:hypothetical protein
MILIWLSSEAFILSGNDFRAHLAEALDCNRRKILVCIESYFGVPALKFKTLIYFLLGRRS